MRITPHYIRSIHGQLSLLAATYSGAIVLAIAAWSCRSLFFEPYVREKFPPLPGEVAAVLPTIAAGHAPAEALSTAIEPLALEEAKKNMRFGVKEPRPAEVEAARHRLWHGVYGAWIERDNHAADGRIAAILHAQGAPFVLERIRQSLVVGSPRQRRRALDLLGEIPDPAGKAEARSLADFARQRAERRQETALVEQAEATSRKLGAGE